MEVNYHGAAAPVAGAGQRREVTGWLCSTQSLLYKLSHDDCK
jgi:hypothetical protein